MNTTYYYSICLTFICATHELTAQPGTLARESSFLSLSIFLFFIFFNNFISSSAFCQTFFLASSFTHVFFAVCFSTTAGAPKPEATHKYLFSFCQQVTRNILFRV
jgi:hypothetical protein